MANSANNGDAVIMGAFKKLEYAFHNCPITICRRMHDLGSFVNCEGNIRLSKGKVSEAANGLPKKHLIREWLEIFRRRVIFGLVLDVR